MDRLRALGMMFGRYRLDFTPLLQRDLRERYCKFYWGFWGITGMGRLIRGSGREWRVSAGYGYDLKEVEEWHYSKVTSRYGPVVTSEQ